jgi:hypothetical protein
VRGVGDVLEDCRGRTRKTAGDSGPGDLFSSVYLGLTCGAPDRETGWQGFRQNRQA